MKRFLLPALLALAACEAEQPPAPEAAVPAGPWINSDDPAPLRDQLAGWKGRKVALLEFSFLA